MEYANFYVKRYSSKCIITIILFVLIVSKTTNVLKWYIYKIPALNAELIIVEGNFNQTICNKIQLESFHSAWLFLIMKWQKKIIITAKWRNLFCKIYFKYKTSLQHITREKIKSSCAFFCSSGNRSSKDKCIQYVEFFLCCWQKPSLNVLLSSESVPLNLLS